MILKRRFPNFIDSMPEEWSEHKVESIKDIEDIEWVRRWDEIRYSPVNNYLNKDRWINTLMGSLIDSDGEKRWLVIGLFDGDASKIGLKEWVRG